VQEQCDTVRDVVYGALGTTLVGCEVHLPMMQTTQSRAAGGSGGSGGSVGLRDDIVLKYNAVNTSNILDQILN
jgi:hypothetical protein